MKDIEVAVPYMSTGANNEHSECLYVGSMT